ncbi:MAG: hypothetical protein EPN82_02155 [Bacteroidetes bacterium]|nr:MAG: hypothetical protein EPN82_02155 [Bacteroidota bacterium]
MIAIHVAAFIHYPFTDSLGIIKEILNGNADFTIDSLPLYVDSSTFSLELINPPPPKLIKYIGVARQLDSLIYHQQVVGVYTESGDKTNPSSLMIREGKTYNIRIEVDFKNLPPQPGNTAIFKGKKNESK